jgi:hypothetical protein
MSGTTGAESDLAIEVIDEHSRMPPLALTLAWWSVVSAMFFVFVAATLALSIGTANALVGIGAAVLFYSVAGAVLARHAIRTGLGCFLLSKVLFGRAGASLATLVLFATAIYYAVFEGSVLVSTALRIISHLGYKAACAIIVLYSVPLVAGSVQHWLNRFNGFLLPFYLIGLVTAVALALHRYGYSARWLELGPGGRRIDARWWDCFVVYLGATVIFMFAQDYARFGRQRDEAYHARFNFGYLFYSVAFAVNGVIGIFLVGTAQLRNVTEASVVDAFIAVLGGPVALIFVWVSQTRINTANYYVSTVNMQAFFEPLVPMRLPKFVWAILVGIVVLTLMLSTNVLRYILVALAYQGSFVTAWVGVALAHVVVDRSCMDGPGERATALGGLPAFDAAGMVAWLSGAASSLLLMQAGGALRTCATPAALLVAALLYAGFGKRPPASD